MTLEHSRRFHDVPLAQADLQRHIWMQLQRAAFDKFHEWHTPALATVDSHGAPQVRTVVLRQVDVTAQQLVFFTDKRSAKLAQVQAQPLGCLLFWSTRLKWQLRVQVKISALIDGPRVDAAWVALAQSPAAADYLSTTAPGSPLHSSDAAAGTAPQLAVLVAEVLEIDWLELAKAGHRRARITQQAFDWLAP
jgi:pyridoxine/pyridoxamine 5'-phosphate oxidase